MKEKVNYFKKLALPLVTLVAIVLVGTFSIIVLNLNDKFQKGNTQIIEALDSYSSYDELNNDIEKINEDNRIILKNGVGFVLNDSIAKDAVQANSNESGSSNKTASKYGKTFTQVDGVDEDDIIKTNGKYIFYLGYKQSKKGYNFYGKPYVFIYTAAGKDSKLINKIKLNAGENASIKGMYLSGNKLIVEIITENMTEIHIFDISDINNIKQLKVFSQSGFINTSRLIKNKLYVVSVQYNNGEIPYVKCGDEKSDIPANKIYKIENPNTISYLVISQIDIDNYSKVEEAKAVLGGVDDVYCNENNLYVIADISKYNFKTHTYDNQSQIFKIDISNGIKIIATAKVKGSTKNQYSLDEYNNTFRVAVTDTGSDNESVNRIYTFDSKLNKIGQLEDFAKGEHIESVKFVNNTAYVVTYETTDPLFVIDLSNPKKLRILGEVKLEGFSTTLIPIDNDKLLGIGTDDDSDDTGISSLKLVLFDISKRNDPKILVEKVCKNISSDAMYDTKSILRNSDKNGFTVYSTFYTDLEKVYYEDDEDYYYDYGEEYGSLSFKVEDNTIKISNKYKSEKLNSSMGRCTFVDDNIYMIDGNQNIDFTKN